jgi:microcystin-dependent protein
MWTTDTAPTGWLLCRGQQVSRATYKGLFNVIGTTYGAGDGSTTFNVPDLQQRFPLGKAVSGTGSTLAGTGGAIDHTHTGGTVSGSTASDGSHTHDVSGSTASDGSHTHDVTGSTDSDGSHTHDVTGSTGSTAPGTGTYNHVLVNGVADTTTPNLTVVVSVDGVSNGNVGHSHTVDSHTHADGTLAAASGGAHTHADGTLAAALGGDHSHADGTLAAASGGAHTHADGTLAAASDGAHTHGAGTLAVGTSGTNNPAFLSLNFVIFSGVA